MHAAAWAVPFLLALLALLHVGTVYAFTLPWWNHARNRQWFHGCRRQAFNQRIKYMLLCLMDKAVKELLHEINRTARLRRNANFPEP